MLSPGLRRSFLVGRLCSLFGLRPHDTRISHLAGGTAGATPAVQRLELIALGEREGLAQPQDSESLAMRGDARDARRYPRRLVREPRRNPTALANTRRRLLEGHPVRDGTALQR
jgi:hypothetical protein